MASFEGSSAGEAINGTGDADVIHGNGGADTLNGLGGDDLLVAGDAGHVLDGGDGDDTLVGGAGSDSLTGGAGNDTFVFSAGDMVVTDFEAAAAKGAIGDVAALADASTETFLRHPRFCALVAILTSVLEQNVSVTRIIELKRVVTGQNARIAGAVHAQLPGATLEDCSWAVGMVATLVGGMWPNVTPSAAAAEVLKMPEFDYLKPKPERDLTQSEVDQIKALLTTTIDQTEKDFAAGIFKNYTGFTTMTGFSLKTAEDAMAFNYYHEAVHTGVMMSIRKFV